MQFICREKSPSYVFRHGGWKPVPGLTGGKPQAVPSLFLQFRSLDQPFQTYLLPAKSKEKGQVAWGVLDTEQEAKRLKRQFGFAVLEKDEEGREVDRTEEQIIEFLYSHRDYGLEFIGIGTDGEELSATERWLVPEGPPELGGRYCRLCRQHIKKAQGIDGHINSGKHQDLLAKALSSDEMTLKLAG